MNESDIGWLLQTIEDPETAERFVTAQYRHGRISYHLMPTYFVNAAGSAGPRMKSSYVTQLCMRDIVCSFEREGRTASVAGDNGLMQHRELKCR